MERSRSSNGEVRLQVWKVGNNEVWRKICYECARLRSECMLRVAREASLAGIKEEEEYMVRDGSGDRVWASARNLGLWI